METTEHHYRDLIDNFTGVIYSTDPAGLIDYVSPRVLDLTGYNATNVTGRHFSFLVLPEDLPAVYDHYTRQLLSRTRETTLEFRALTRDGETKWVEQIAVLREKDGIPTGFQCFVRDISEKKALQSELGIVERRLREHQALMESILENANAMIFVKDTAGRYLMANRRFYETMRRSETEVLGQTDYTLFSTAQADRYKAFDKQVLASGQSEAIEEVLEGSSGTIHLLVTKFPLPGNDGDIAGIGGIATDITDRARYQQALVAAREEAEDARKMQEQFLANMSHEIRTPMNGIQGMTHLLRDTPLNPQQAEFVSLIARSAANLLVIIIDILDFSKIKAGKLQIEHIDYRLADVLDNVRALFSDRMARNNVPLSVTVDPGVPEWIQGDPHRLNQILINLVGNAVKFTPKGSIRVNVGIGERRPGQVVLEFTIADEGIGISGDNLQSIFNPFEQAAADVTRKFGGTGLGLAICQQLLKLQGGDIQLTSREGIGTTVRFRLPVGIEPPTVHERPPVIGQFEGFLANLTFLVAEDNPINQKVTEHVLRKAGAEVTLAGDGEEAIRLLATRRFDLIVMDLQMPVMDGYAATRHIRQVLRLDTPILAMTASAIKGERLRCLEAGMNEYMSKPFEFADFYQRVGGMLRATSEPPVSDVRTKPTGVFDLSLLSEVGDEDYVRDIIRTFIDTLPIQLAELETAMSAADPDRIYLIAHRLRGSTGMLQATAISDRLGRLERLAKQKADCRSLVEELIPRFEQLRSELREYLSPKNLNHEHTCC
jgi:PAS domain S-box-containing protein